MIATYGLTGGIASGKTTVGNIFEELGVTVVDADVIAKGVAEEPAIKQQIAAHFGAFALLPNGQLDRARLRQCIFTAPQDKRWLEQLLHPRIREVMKTIRQHTQGIYMLFIVPLLIENFEHYSDLTGIIVVDTDEAEQKRRLELRDKHDDAFIDKLIASQTSRQRRLMHADFVLHNHHDMTDLRRQVLALHQILLHTKIHP